MNRVPFLSWLISAVLAAPAMSQDLVPTAAAGQAASALTFVANRGQWDPGVAFQMHSGPATAWFHDRGVVLDLVKHEAEPADTGLQSEGVVGPPESRIVGRATVRLSFGGAAATTPVGVEQRRGTMSYLYGADPRGWFDRVPTFGRLRYEQVYRGIDAVFRSEGPWLAYDFHVAPGVSADAIELHCDGTDGIELRADGSLRMRTRFGDVVQSAPRSFEITSLGERVPVASRFVLRGNDRYGFATDRIDPSRALVIDPGIDWSTFVSGPGSTFGTGLYACTHVRDQIVVTAGRTDCIALPAPWNSNPNAGGRDAVVAVIDTAVSGPAAVLWSALIGGSADEIAFDVTCDATTMLVTIVGMTASANFPPLNANQAVFGGQWDGFIATFDMAGTLLTSTYVGTAGIDRLGAVQANATQLTIAGYTDSPGFPMAGTPYQPALAGSVDVVVVQFNPFLPPGTQILRSTYLGGTSMEGFWNLATFIANMDLIDLQTGNSGEVTVISRCAGPGFPVLNPMQPAYLGAQGDLVIARLDAQLSTLLYGTYFGSLQDDGSNSMRVDDAGIVTLSGFSWGSGLPVTPGAPQVFYSGSFNDVIVARLDPSQPPTQQLLYGTYLGTSGHQAALDMEAEPSSRIVIASGLTDASMGATPGAMQPAFVPSWMGFVVRLEPGNNGMQGVHYLSHVGPPPPGGSQATNLLGIAMLADGRVALSGKSTAAAFPMLATSPQPAFLGPDDGILLVMDLLPNGVMPIGTGSPVCAQPLAHMQVNSAPLPGNANFQLLCEQAPPSAPVLLVFGVPYPGGAVILGATLFVQPSGLMLVLSDPRGLARFDLPIPPGLPMPAGIALQFGWLLPAPCGGAILGASNALVL